jgi:hypothetical protein
MMKIELRPIRRSTLSPQARALYLALRRDFSERLRSLIMSDDLTTISAIASRRLDPHNEVRKSWTALDNALREIRRNCRDS